VGVGGAANAGEKLSFTGTHCLMTMKSQSGAEANWGSWGASQLGQVLGHNHWDILPCCTALAAIKINRQLWVGGVAQEVQCCLASMKSQVQAL
jgi:hypothetical protein